MKPDLLSGGSPLQMRSVGPFDNANECTRSRAEPNHVRKARRFVHEHLTEELSLGRAAKAANISANHLSEKFKEVTGISFVHYVTWMRFEKARALLANRNIPITVIAFEVGFQSLSQFNRVFKKLVGKSPRKYRQEMVLGDAHDR